MLRAELSPFLCANGASEKRTRLPQQKHTFISKKDALDFLLL